MFDQRVVSTLKPLVVCNSLKENHVYMFMLLRNSLKFSIKLFLMRLNQLVNAINRNYFNTTCMQIIMQTVQE